MSKQGVDAEHQDHHEVVAGEVAQVVVDPGLHLSKIGRFGQSLEIKELGDGFKIGESRGQGLGSYTSEPVRQVQSRRDYVDGDLQSRHCVGLAEVTWKS